MKKALFVSALLLAVSVAGYIHFNKNVKFGAISTTTTSTLDPLKSIPTSVTCSISANLTKVNGKTMATLTWDMTDNAIGWIDGLGYLPTKSDKGAPEPVTFEVSSIRNITVLVGSGKATSTCGTTVSPI